MSHFPRGSEWRQWDLHVHTPASFHWNGQRFDPDPSSPTNVTLVDQMIQALNEASPAVFALMDYWTFDGWRYLQRRRAQSGAPKLNKVVFPGIELRLMSPSQCRLNAHVLFSNDVTDQTLADFRSSLKVELVNRPLSEESLVELARFVGEDKLKHHGFKKSEVDQDLRVALRAGAMMAEINVDSYKDAIRNVPNGHAIGFMPFDTSDGLKEVDWREHYAYVLGLFANSPIFETRDEDRRSAFVNEITSGNAKWIANFQRALNNVPRLAISGSDAHSFKGTAGDNDRRGYGQFPSGKATWIKADPSFRGLLQAIMEPAKRSYVGIRPPKLIDVDESKTFYIDRVEVMKLPSGTEVGHWLDQCALPINPDLVAIIGNKGSGKSALADIIGLLGNSRQKLHFSFLKKDRFRGKSGEPAKHFEGTLVWCDGVKQKRNLNEDPPSDIELVRYVPQGHFEELCNDHVSGRSNAFEKELRTVIFSHADDSVRQGALDFDQLIEQQEGSFRDRLSESRKELRRVNEEITSIEAQLQPPVRQSLVELLTLKKKQIDEHEKIRPDEKPVPSAQLTPEQQAATDTLASIATKLNEIEQRSFVRTSATVVLARRQRGLQNMKDRLRQLERAYQQFEDDASHDLQLLGLEAKDLAH